MSRLRLGIIGHSTGNGHPYSWSAIFNGYDVRIMASCPYPAIPAYLAQQRFPEDSITAATVTHIWTQDTESSAHIAAAARIPTIVNDPRDMIGEVDAILLARDDADRHIEFAAPFLDAGLPIFIDKPLAFTVADAHALYARQRRPGQIFTCSALRYADEFKLSAPEMAALGHLRYVEAVTVKDWDHYAIHVIEPLCEILGGLGTITVTAATGTHARHLDISLPNNLSGRITTLGTSDGPVAIRIFGDLGWRHLDFRDAYSAFRAALQHFIDIVLGALPPQNPPPVLEVIRLIEAGRTSK